MIGLEWIPPVFDRSLEDLAAAKQAVIDVKSGKRVDFGELRGCLTAESLNRIENDILVLSNVLGLSLICKEWADIVKYQPSTDDEIRILSNANAVRNKIITDYEYTYLAPPEHLKTYLDFNTLEEGLDLASDIMFHPLRTQDEKRLVIADDATPLSVNEYDYSNTALNGCMVIDRQTYEDIQKDANTLYIVTDTNEVMEYLGTILISR